MRYLQKIVRNGSSVGVTIPSKALAWLQWRAGNPIVLEVNADRTITLRPPRTDDIGVTAPPGNTVGSLPEYTR